MIFISATFELKKKKKDVLYLIALDLPQSYAVLGQQKKKYREN